MAATIELLGTDMFREHHRRFGVILSQIESELESAKARGGGWRDALPTFRRLLVLLEGHVEHELDEEERLIYNRLREREGLTPVLHDGYREHNDIRLATERLHKELVAAASGHEAHSLFAHAATLIELVRVHMAREDEVLFLAAEQTFSHEELERMTVASPTWP